MLKSFARLNLLLALCSDTMMVYCTFCIWRNGWIVLKNVFKWFSRRRYGMIINTEKLKMHSIKLWLNIVWGLIIPYRNTRPRLITYRTLPSIWDLHWSGFQVPPMPTWEKASSTVSSDGFNDTVLWLNSVIFIVQ